MRRPLDAGTLAGPSNKNNQGALNKVVIARVGSDGKVDNTYTATGTLLLNPESMEESIVSNWTPNAVPGQSLPPLYWANGGPRTVSFDALVTRDTSDFMKPTTQADPLAAAVSVGINAVGSIASSFLGVKVPPLGDLFGSLTDPTAGEQLGITDKLAYYRALCFPNYAQGIIDTSPPLVVLYYGKTLGHDKTTPTTQLSPDSDVWVLVDLKIRFTKWLPNMTPMEATCSFRFLQYPIIPLSRGHFDGSIDNLSTPAGLASKAASAIRGLF